MKVKALISSGIGVIVMYLSCKIWNQTKQLRNNEITIQQLEEQNRNQLLEIRNLEIKAQALDEKDQQILLQKRQLENKTQTLTNQEITIQNQKQSLKNLENQIQVKTLEIQNLNNIIRDENIRVKDQINTLQGKLISLNLYFWQKKKKQIKSCPISKQFDDLIQKQNDNMIDKITKLLELRQQLLQNNKQQMPQKISFIITIWNRQKKRINEIQIYFILIELKIFKQFVFRKSF